MVTSRGGERGSEVRPHLQWRREIIGEVYETLRKVDMKEKCFKVNLIQNSLTINGPTRRTDIICENNKVFFKYARLMH